VFMLSGSSLRRTNQPSRKALTSVVCLITIEEPHRGGLDPLELSIHENKTKFFTADLLSTISKSEIIFRITLYLGFVQMDQVLKLNWKT
jgi:hypothetical protein